MGGVLRFRLALPGADEWAYRFDGEALEGTGRRDDGRTRCHTVHRAGPGLELQVAGTWTTALYHPVPGR